MNSNLAIPCVVCKRSIELHSLDDLRACWDAGVKLTNAPVLTVEAIEEQMRPILEATGQK